MEANRLHALVNKFGFVRQWYVSVRGAFKPLAWHAEILSANINTFFVHRTERPSAGRVMKFKNVPQTHPQTQYLFLKSV